MTGTETEHKKKGIEVKSVRKGYQSIVHRGDGTAVKFWAPSESEARHKAIDHVVNIYE